MESKTTQFNRFLWIHCVIVSGWRSRLSIGGNGASDEEKPHVRSKRTETEKYSGQVALAKREIDLMFQVNDLSSQLGSIKKKSQTFEDAE